MTKISRKYRNAVLAGNSSDKEKITSPSMTIPDQGLTVRQIIDKYAQGTISDIANNEQIYSEDLPDLRGLDIAELHEMKIQARQDIKDIEREIKDRKKSSPTQIEEAVIITDNPSPTFDNFKNESK